MDESFHCHKFSRNVTPSKVIVLQGEWDGMWLQKQTFASETVFHHVETWNWLHITTKGKQADTWWDTVTLFCLFVCLFQVVLVQSREQVADELSRLQRDNESLQGKHRLHVELQQQEDFQMPNTVQVCETWLATFKLNVSVSRRAEYRASNRVSAFFLKSLEFCSFNNKKRPQKVIKSLTFHVQRSYYFFCPAVDSNTIFLVVGCWETFINYKWNQWIVLQEVI